MTASTNRHPLGSSANTIVSGFISTGASWIEDVEMSEDGAAITDADDFTWQFNFRKEYANTSADLALSTTAGTLTIVQGSESTTLQIRVDPEDLSNLDGDYLADLVYEDGDGNRIHQAHGTVTFVYEPIWVG